MSNSDRLVQNFFDYHVDFRHRIIYLGSYASEDNEVDASMAEYAIKGLFCLDTNSDRDITVILNTPGGTVEDGMAIYDTIKQCRSFVKGLVLGAARSMGSIILQACDRRIMGTHAYLMIHQGSMSLENNLREFKSEAQFSFKYCERVDEILYKRIKEKHPRYPRSTFKKLLSTDTFLTAQEAVDLGLADEVV